MLDKVDDAQLSLLITEHEQEVIREIDRFDKSIAIARDSYEPSVMVRQIMAIARAFNTFYHHTAVLKTGNEHLTVARLALSRAVGQTLKAGLRLMGITPVDRM